MDSADGQAGRRFAKKGLDQGQQFSLTMPLGQTGGGPGAPQGEPGIGG